MSQAQSTYYRDRRTGAWLVWIPERRRRGEYLTVDVRRRGAASTDRKGVRVISVHRKHSLAVIMDKPPSHPKRDRRREMIDVWRARHVEKGARKLTGEPGE